MLVCSRASFSPHVVGAPPPTQHSLFPQWPVVSSPARWFVLVSRLVVSRERGRQRVTQCDGGCDLQTLPTTAHCRALVLARWQIKRLWGDSPIRRWVAAGCC